jgi:hypothetical protein
MAKLEDIKGKLNVVIHFGPTFFQLFFLFKESMMENSAIAACEMVGMHSIRLSEAILKSQK